MKRLATLTLALALTGCVSHAEDGPILRKGVDLLEACVVKAYRGELTPAEFTAVGPHAEQLRTHITEVCGE